MNVKFLLTNINELFINVHEQQFMLILSGGMFFSNHLIATVL